MTLSPSIQAPSGLMSVELSEMLRTRPAAPVNLCPPLSSVPSLPSSCPLLQQLRTA